MRSLGFLGPSWADATSGLVYFFPLNGAEEYHQGIVFVAVCVSFRMMRCAVILKPSHGELLKPNNTHAMEKRVH